MQLQKNLCVTDQTIYVSENTHELEYRKYSRDKNWKAIEIVGLPLCDMSQKLTSNYIKIKPKTHDELIKMVNMK